MASRPGIPVNIVISGGRAVTQVASSAITAGQVMTPTAAPGQAITLVASGGRNEQWQTECKPLVL